MAYIASKILRYSSGTSATFAVTLPSDIQADDVIYAFMFQRYTSGSTNFTAPTGWSGLIGSKVTSSSSHMQWCYEVAAGTEGGTSVTFTGNSTGYWTIHLYVIRDADVTGTPHLEASATHAGDSVKKFFPTVDTTGRGNGQLLLFATSAYNRIDGTYVSPNDITPVFQANHPENNTDTFTGYAVQDTAGVTTAYSYWNGNQGGEFVLAIANKTGGAIQPHLKTPVDTVVFKCHGTANEDDFVDKAGTDYTGSSNGTTDIITVTGHSLSNGDIITATAGGLGTNFDAGRTFRVINVSGNDFQIAENHAETVTNINTSGSVGLSDASNFIALDNDITATIDGISTSAGFHQIFPSGSSLTCTPEYDPVGATEFVGFTYIFPSSVDFTNKVLSFQYINNTTNTSFWGTRGLVVVFGDGTNWSAFQCADQLTHNHNVTETFTVSPSGTTFDNSGTLSTTAVTKISFLWERKQNNGSAQTFGFKNINILDVMTLVGGSSAAPATINDVILPLSINGGEKFVLKQGAGQYILKSSLQIGNGGTNETHFSANANANGNPQSYVVDQTDRYQWNVPNQDIDLNINAGSSDSCDFSNSLITSDTFQKFTIASGSSASATWNFSGCVMVGRDVTLSDIGANAYTGLLISGCKEISYNTLTSGSALSGITIDTSDDTQAITLNGATQVALQALVDNISSCIFSNNTVALRIEYTGTGDITINFDDITWTSNTTDIHYNSTNASALTANMQNGSNASTTAISGSATGVTISNDVIFTVNVVDENGNGLTGSEVTVLETGTTTVADSGAMTTETMAGTSEAYTFTAPLGVNVDVQVFKPGYEGFWQANLDLGTADSSITATLRSEAAYEA